MSECHECRDWGKYETHADHTRGGGGEVSDYTPSTEEIRNHLRSLAHLAGRDGDADGAMLDRWLTAHDAEVARKAKAEALRDVAAKWTDEIYPVDIFIPLTAEDHAEINRVLKEHFGRSSARDAISGDMMRRAANLLRLHADEIETEARADTAMDVYDRQMDNDFNSLDDDGVLDDLANDYRGIDDTAQGRGDV